MKSVNLGKKAPKLEPIAVSHPASGEKAEKQIVHYPSIHLHADGKDGESLHSMPDKGVMHIHYAVHARHSEARPDGTTHHSVEMHLHKIHDADADKPREEKPTGEALDDLANEARPNAPDAPSSMSYVGQNVGMHTP